MRYLTRAFTLGALRRDKAIEQFLGPVDVAGVAGIRWVSVGPADGLFRVAVHTAMDIDDDFRDLPNLPPLCAEEEQYVGEGTELGRAADPLAAIELAERLTGATPERWVNEGVAGDDYADLVLTRRRDT
ncbi:hypothetical protein AB0K00_36620 [Dactylosporangium sp. NPDC049525]|uniref:hypothetical protein n=1 Tax=Dactylosporangium sp. NPDC049525 TaxID=3154730 RepID=UPI003428039E